MEKYEKLVTYAYKHNGDFHRVWTENQLLQETKDYYVVATNVNTKVIEIKNYYWYTKEVAINYFSKKHWFNVIVMYKPKEVVYYCNMATPIFEEVGTLKYIDYDLDVKYFTNSQKIKILDRKEFRTNKYQYKYPKWLEKKILKELSILQYWIKNELGPFSPKFRNKWYNEMMKIRSFDEQRNNIEDK